MIKQQLQYIWFGTESDLVYIYLHTHRFICKQETISITKPNYIDHISLTFIKTFKIYEKDIMVGSR